MSAADLMAVLLARHLRYDFTEPKAPGNDQLIFSKGLPVGVGLAITGKSLDRLPYRVWVLCGDSELAEAPPLQRSSCG